ncbi:MAG TPA: amidase family protein [Candidatus Dormibacteraeota bacterium]|nr:amidase family protein [Candidatus Dormibacteraeota bacterium]
MHSDRGWRSANDSRVLRKQRQPFSHVNLFVGQFLLERLDECPHRAYSRVSMSSDAFLSVSAITAAVRSKTFSASEFLQAHLLRIERLQPKLNAFVHIDGDAARTTAGQIDAAMQRGGADATAARPLLGVPVTLKSCIDVAGWPCPAGSLLRKDYVASCDAPLVTRLRAAGAILLGNTNTPEFLMAYETDNRLQGKTSNPWALDHSSGGSSGGESAAIASGCSAGGVGSDGGGSIRVPAHFCGICGLKPTPGRVPATGHFPPCGGAFSWIGVVGPMARSVADLRALFTVMAGPDPGDPLSAPVPVANIFHDQLKNTRIGILESDALGNATEETRQAVSRAAKLLESAGFHVEPVRLTGLDCALELWWYFFGAVIAHLLGHTVAGKEDLLSSQLREYLAVATSKAPLLLDGFLQACAARDLLRESLIREMAAAGTPILLSPVSSGPAFRHGAGNYQPGSGYLDTMRYSQWLNLTGFPGASVPVAFSSDGLPIGVQIIGCPYDDELVLAVAEALEAARGPWQNPQI